MRVVRRRAKGMTAGYAVAELEAALAPPADPRAAGFFDVDNTMMQGASIYYFARGLAARKYFTTGDLVRFGLQQLRFRVLANEHGGDMSRAKETALAFVAGRPVDDMPPPQRGDLRRVDGVADLVRHARAGPAAPRRRPAGLAGHRRARRPRRGHRPAARADRGDRHRRRDRRNGVYTGRLVGDLHARPGQGRGDPGSGRTRRASTSASARPTATRSTTCPCSRAVGRAVAVNPDSALRRAARERGWEIRDFRTGRKAAKIAVPAAVGAGAVAGAVAAAIALNRRGVFRPHRSGARRIRRQSSP